MKKIVLSLGVCLTSAVVAAPTFNMSPSTLSDGTSNTININYVQDATAGVAYAANFDFTLPAGVTISNVTATTATQCTLDGTSTIKINKLGLSTLPSEVVCNFDIVVPAGATGVIPVAVDSESHASINGDIVLPAPNSVISDFTISSGGSAFNTTVNYSVGAGTGTGTFTCDSGQSGATVAGGTAVSCTAAPNGTDTSAITGCPAGATTSTNTICAFTASTTADETVNLVATFTAAGTGPGGPGGPNPSTPGAARPVPALGVFGLLAMLASMFGAATLVLRRKR